MAKSIRKFLKSFTLIELIIVIAIIAVLGASAFLVLSQWMSKSRDSRKIADLGTIDTAINISITSNDKLPSPDNFTKVMFSGNRIWDIGYFGDEVVKQIGGSITKTPIDPTTKERYRYAQWANKKYQLGTIIENQQFSKYLNRTYAQSYFTKVQGNYNQSIIVAKIDNVDTILPVPSLIVDKYEGEEKILDEEHFWTNKSSYNLGGNQSTKLKVQSLFSGDINKLSDTTSTEFTQFIDNFEQVYTGTNFVSILNNQSDDEIKVAVAQELSKVSSQPVSVLFLTCEGYNHGEKVDFYQQEIVGYGESCDSIKFQFECNNGNWIGVNKAEYTKTTCNVTLPAQCDGNDHGTVKDFYSVDSVAFGQNCTPNLKSFTCENGTWKEGGSNADTTTYQYTSCVVGNPVDCNATNIVKKSVTNSDITFDIPSTLHGLSFERVMAVTENNGSYEYTLVGDCSNGIYQEVILSQPIFKNCNGGYTYKNNQCEMVIQWTGNSTIGFKLMHGLDIMYPKSCNDLLVSTNPNFKFGNTSPYNGTSFVNGVYWIKPNLDDPYPVYCNMTNNGGGRTLLASITGESQKFADKTTNGIWKNPVYDTYAMTGISNKDYMSLAYGNVTTKNILLCYQNINTCYNFQHNLDIPLYHFFRDNISYADYTYDLVGYGNTGSSTKRNTFFSTMGISPATYGVCNFFGINYLINKGTTTGLIIGFGGDTDGPCISKNNTISSIDNYFLGLGGTYRVYNYLSSNSTNPKYRPAGVQNYQLTNSQTKTLITTEYGNFTAYHSNNWFIMGK